MDGGGQLFVDVCPLFHPEFFSMVLRPGTGDRGFAFGSIVVRCVVVLGCRGHVSFNVCRSGDRAKDGKKNMGCREASKKIALKPIN